MGFHVGIPTLKLSNKVGGNASRKRTGTLRSVACEALKERWSRDPDVDHDRTRFNWYDGITSGLELTERMTQEAEAYSKKRKEAGGRALRSTASIGFVTIVKPDMDVINGLTPEQRERFFKDSNEILDGILGKDNVRARVIHRDELGEHEHVFRMGFTQDGKLSVDNLVNPQIWRKVNLEYPQKMREKGWNGKEKDGITLPCVDDCEMYDAEKAEADPDYLQERRAKRKAAGRGSSKYKADKDRARAAALDSRQAELDARAAALDAQAMQQQRKQEAQDARQAELDAQAARQQRVQEAQDATAIQQKRGQEALNKRQAKLDADIQAAEAANRQKAAEVAAWSRSVQNAIPELVRESMQRELETAKTAQPPRRPNVQNAAQDAIAKAQAMSDDMKAREQARQAWAKGHQGQGYGY